MDSRFGTLDREVVKMKNEKGLELVEVTELKVFDEPHEMYVWDDAWKNEKPVKKCVCAIIPYRHAGSVITTNGAYEHCAEIPEKPAPRRATWLELSKWCSNGNGLVLDELAERIDTGVMFKVAYQNNPLDGKIKVRKWNDTEWHTPDVEYLGIEE